MRKTVFVAMALAVAAGLATARDRRVIQESIVVPEFTTNAVVRVAIGEAGTRQYRSIDRIVAVHSSGSATGTVSFAVMEHGTDTALFSTEPLKRGDTAAVWPRCTAGADAYTNAVQWSVMVLTAAVSQGGSPTPDVYMLTIYAE